MRFEDMLRNDHVSFYRVTSSSKINENSQNIFERLSRFASKERSQSRSNRADLSSTKKKDSQSKCFSQNDSLISNVMPIQGVTHESRQTPGTLAVSQAARFSNLALVNSLNDENSKNSRVDANFQIELKDNKISKNGQEPSALTFNPEGENIGYKQNECRNLAQSFNLMTDAAEDNKISQSVEKQGASEDNLEDLVERLRNEKMDLETHAVQTVQTGKAVEESKLYEESNRMSFQPQALKIEMKDEVKISPQKTQYHQQKFGGLTEILEGLYKNYKVSAVVLKIHSNRSLEWKN